MGLSEFSFQQYQEEASRTAIFPQGQAVVYTALGLGNEAGEVQGVVKKYIRGDFENQERLHPFAVAAKGVAKELGDVLWYVSAVSDAWGLDLEDVARGNLEKLRGRQERGTIGGNGDDR